MLLYKYLSFKDVPCPCSTLSSLSKTIVFQIASTTVNHCKVWTDSILFTIWSPPLLGTIKANFDVVLSSNFAVTATVISDSNGNTIRATTKKILTKDVALGEVQATLLAVHTVASCSVYSLILEGDALNVVLAIQQPQLFEG
jgi:hypothetical protein